MSCLSIILSFSLVVIISSQACPDGWRQSDVVPNKCYYVGVIKKTWFAAESFCKGAASNGHLTTITSAFENVDLQAVIISTPSVSTCDQIWIGAKDFTVNGQYTWVDGNPSKYYHWAPGQPDRTKPCVSMVARTTGLWKTEPCGVENCFVCEMFTSSSGNTTGTMTTTSPITGTTQTPRPTPSNACHTKNCTGTLGYPGNCSFSGNVATCHCPGNLDPDSCGKVGCVKKMNGGQVVNQAGPFWSPGYNGYNGTYGGNLDCYWILSQGGQQVNITLKAFKTASDATLTLRTNSGNYPLSGDLTNILDLINRRLQSAIAGSTSVTFEFTNTNAGSPGDYFDIGLSFISPPTT